MRSSSRRSADSTIFGTSFPRSAAGSFDSPLQATDLAQAQKSLPPVSLELSHVTRTRQHRVIRRGVIHRRFSDEQGLVQAVTTTLKERSLGTQTPPVDVETWFLHCAAGRWRSAPPDISPLPSGIHPHVVAETAAAQRIITPDVVHSTSWRMVAGRLVVTYIIVTSDDLGRGSFDVHPDRTHDFTGTSADHATTPDDPTSPPEAVTDWNVVHHALHHLALLASTNASIAAALSASARRSLRPLVPAGAGVLTTMSCAS